MALGKDVYCKEFGCPARKQGQEDTLKNQRHLGTVKRANLHLKFTGFEHRT